MQPSTCDGQVVCGTRQWPVHVEWLPAAPLKLLFDRYPSPGNRNDIAYGGKGTVIPKEGATDLPTSADLCGGGVLLLLDALPNHGRCKDGPWQLPIHVTRVTPLADGKGIQFEFLQNGCVGRTIS